MADLGLGTSDYPSSLDTNPTPQFGTDLSSPSPVLGASQALIKTQTELGINPAENLATLKAFQAVDHDSDGKPKLLQVEHGSDGVHSVAPIGNFTVGHNSSGVHTKVPDSCIIFIVDNISGTTTASILGSKANNICMPWAGSVVGASTLLSGVPASSNVAYYLSKNGSTLLGPVIQVDGTPLYRSITWAVGTYTFSAGDRLKCSLAAVAGANVDVISTMFINFSF